MGFTSEELAEMARADAEIEATFCITNEEIAFGRSFDREAVLENMDARRRRTFESQRQYRAANKDKIAESQRQYRAANKDKIAESKRQYYAANKDKIAESKRQYYAANKDKIAESKRQYRAANKDKIAESQRQYYAANKDKIAESQRQYRAANKDKIAESKRAIHKLRCDLGLTQRAFGDLLGVSQPTVYYWENISAPKNWREIVETYTPRA